MTQQQKEELKKEFGEFLQKNNAGKYFKDGNMIDAYGNCDFIEDYWLSVIDQLIQERENLQNRNIGMMRQWLNEDRITDIKKMVSSKDIKYWLDLKE